MAVSDVSPCGGRSSPALRTGALAQQEGSPFTTRLPPRHPKSVPLGVRLPHGTSGRTGLRPQHREGWTQPAHLCGPAHGHHSLAHGWYKPSRTHPQRAWGLPPARCWDAGTSTHRALQGTHSRTMSRHVGEAPGARVNAGQLRWQECTGGGETPLGRMARGRRRDERDAEPLASEELSTRMSSRSATEGRQAAGKGSLLGM